MNLLTTKFMGGEDKSINAINSGLGNTSEGSYSRYSMPDENQGWNEREGQRLGSPSSYSMPGGNKGWNDEWKERWNQREWYNKDSSWSENDQEEYAHLCDSKWQEEQGVDLESCWTKDMLTKILSKVEGSDMVLQEMKTNLSSLNQTVISHSTSIKQLETQMIQLSVHCNQQSLVVLT